MRCEAQKGEHFSAFVEQCCHASATLGEPVFATFNGVTFVVRPNDSAADLYQLYEGQLVYAR